MDITITEVGKFYTINLDTEHAINWTRLNWDIPSWMQNGYSQFFMDEADITEYLQKILNAGLTASINNRILELNQDGTVVYQQLVKGTNA